MPYSTTLMEHFRQPSRAGLVPVGNARVVWVGDPRRGGVIVLQSRLDDPGRIADVRFQAYGCGATIAAASWVSDWLMGRTLEQAAGLNDRLIAAALELPPAKLHCAVLAMAAVRAMIDDYVDSTRDSGG